MDTHDCHDCVSSDGITFTCPICGRQYRFDGYIFDIPALTVMEEGNPNALHTGAWGAAVKSVDATVPAGPARPDLFSRN